MVASVEVPVTAKNPVVVAFCAARLVMIAFVVVLFVTVSPAMEARVEKKLVIVPFVEKRFVEVALVVVLFPITAFDAVRLVTVAVRAFRSVAKRFDDEALVRVAKVEKRLVFVAFVISLFTPAMFVA